jgi:hypothetical protein
MPALTTNCLCEYCTKHRALGNHKRCSKLRQAMHARAKDK